MFNIEVLEIEKKELIWEGNLKMVLGIKMIKEVRIVVWYRSYLPKKINCRTNNKKFLTNKNDLMFLLTLHSNEKKIINFIGLLFFVGRQLN